MKQTQKDFIIAQLKRHKKIDRNFCLQNYLSRLGAYIKDLEYEGWVFKAGYDERRNYVYHLVSMPKGV